MGPSRFALHGKTIRRSIGCRRSERELRADGSLPFADGVAIFNMPRDVCLDADIVASLMDPLDPVRRLNSYRLPAGRNILGASPVLPSPRADECNVGRGRGLPYVVLSRQIAAGF